MSYSELYDYMCITGVGSKEDAELVRTMRKEGEGYSDWEYGATLINEDYFTDYAKDLADDLHSTTKEASWPFNHIDWKAAAEELKQNYSEINYAGTTFYIRD